MVGGAEFVKVDLNQGPRRAAVKESADHPGFPHSYPKAQKAYLQAVVQLPLVPVTIHPSRANLSASRKGNIWAFSDGAPPSVGGTPQCTTTHTAPLAAVPRSCSRY